MAEIKKQLPVNEKEVALLKMIFKDNESLIKIIRNLFFGFEISKQEKDLIISTFKNDEVKNLFRKKIYPKISSDQSIFSMSDFWYGSESQIFGASRDVIQQVIKSKKRVKEMLDIAMNLLDNPDGIKNSIEYDPDNDPTDVLQVGLIARNLYINTIYQGLNWIWVISNQDKEKPQERKKRQALDSTE